MDSALTQTHVHVIMDGKAQNVTKVCYSFILTSKSGSQFLGSWFERLVACVSAICFPPDGCLNGGECIAPGYCSCAQDWSGYKCEESKHCIFFICALLVKLYLSMQETAL